MNCSFHSRAKIISGRNPPPNGNTGTCLKGSKDRASELSNITAEVGNLQRNDLFTALKMQQLSQGLHD